MKIEIDKPVIPQFIADWIEKEKTYSPFDKSFARVINLVNRDKDWIKWKYEVDGRWSRILATAFLHGYEVEKEPLYYAKIKGWELTKGESVFWNYRLVIADPMPPRLYTSGKEDGFFVINKMTIEEWNKAGINNTNADFEKVCLN